MHGVKQSMVIDLDWENIKMTSYATQKKYGAMPVTDHIKLNLKISGNLFLEKNVYIISLQF